MGLSVRDKNRPEGRVLVAPPTIGTFVLSPFRWRIRERLLASSRHVLVQYLGYNSEPNSTTLPPPKYSPYPCLAAFVVPWYYYCIVCYNSHHTAPLRTFPIHPRVHHITALPDTPVTSSIILFRSPGRRRSNRHNRRESARPRERRHR